MGSAECHDDADSCNYRVCICDKKATECFFNNLETYDNRNKEKEVRDKCKLGFDSSSNCELDKLSLEMSLRLVASKKDSSVKTENTKSMNVNNARNDAARKMTCMAGTVANYEQTSCLSCQPGTYTPSSGWYCTSPSSCRCNSCPDGYVCPQEGTINPKTCQAGELVNYSKTKCDNVRSELTVKLVKSGIALQLIAKIAVSHVQMVMSVHAQVLLSLLIVVLMGVP